MNTAFNRGGDKLTKDLCTFRPPLYSRIPFLDSSSGRCGGHSQRLPAHASFAEEVALPQNGHHGFTSVPGRHCQLHIATLNVEHRVSFITLCINDLPVYVVAIGADDLTICEELRTEQFCSVDREASLTRVYLRFAV